MNPRSNTAEQPEEPAAGGPSRFRPEGPLREDEQGGREAWLAAQGAGRIRDADFDTLSSLPVDER
jgi:hypothetical protein